MRSAPGDADASSDTGGALEGDGEVHSVGSSKLRDRDQYVLPLTHEETVTFHTREIQSYRDLPQMLYHFQTKHRDEPRPRAGLIRVRGSS